MKNPPKSTFMSIKTKTLKKSFFISFFCFSFKNDRRTHVVLVNSFKNVLKNVINCQKWSKWRFWWLIVFFSAYSKILTKRTFVRQLFLMLNQRRNTKNKFVGGFFIKNQKRAFWGSKMVVFKTQISNLYFCVCSLM